MVILLFILAFIIFVVVISYLHRKLLTEEVGFLSHALFGIIFSSRYTLDLFDPESKYRKSTILVHVCMLAVLVWLVCEFIISSPNSVLDILCVIGILSIFRFAETIIMGFISFLLESCLEKMHFVPM